MMSSARFNPALLACPSCRSALTTSPTGVQCGACGLAFGVTQGFINLVLDSSNDTQLQEAAYDEEHGINQQRRESNWLSWQGLLEKYGAHHGRVLEIGAGSGHLTWGLLHKSRFDELHISDISADFLQGIFTQHDPGNRDTCYYLCDANHLPFADNTMDCIIGNSVLHHFIDYEQTLRSALATLKPGGKAFFFEPVQSGKAFISLLARLLWKVDSHSPAPLFTDEQHRRLRHITVRMVNQAGERNAQSDLTALGKLEDKYIFNLAALEGLCRQIGYSGFVAENQLPFDYSYWLQLANQLELGPVPFDRKALKHYEYLFNTVRDTLGVMIRDSMTSPMVYLVFTK
jgi:ubiquinone/menaquinone biosynthesis C-methylase UbiE